MFKAGGEMKSKSSSVLTIAEKCKNILASNWQGNLNTIKADAQGSKEDIYSSKVKYIIKKGKPYLWVLEKDLHNVNTIIDERGSFSVSSPLPGPLAHVLRSIKKLPARVAMTGDVLRLKDEKWRDALPTSMFAGCGNIADLLDNLLIEYPSELGPLVLALSRRTGLRFVFVISGYSIYSEK